MAQKALEKVRAEVFGYFEQMPVKVHRLSDLGLYLQQQRTGWHLPGTVTSRAFVRFLAEIGKLKEVVIPFPKPYKREVRYSWGDVSFYELALSLKPHAYFSHYTAVKFHGLTEQLPKTLYLNVEQFNASISTAPLTQKAIDVAFQRRPRTSGNIAEVGDYRVCVISGKQTGGLGVVEEPVVEGAGPLRFTGLERTLIDIAVRPVYSGGVFEVRKAYKLSKDKVSPDRLASMLQELSYTYPYHQAVGFYLERAGFTPGELQALRRRPMDFDFYLAPQMSQTDYIKDWRLHVPKGF